MLILGAFIGVGVGLLGAIMALVGAAFSDFSNRAMYTAAMLFVLFVALFVGCIVFLVQVAAGVLP
jgi:FtsH-binding integral membrane protein